MKINLLTYSDARYRSMQAKLVEHAQSLGVFDFIYTKDRSDLTQTDFYKTHKKILDNPIGAGLCLWKVYYIINTLSRMEEGGVLLYMDSADWIFNSENMREKIKEKMSDTDIVITAGAFANKMYTKRDCFFYMGCDSDEYWNAPQVEAGVILIKNSDYSIRILLEWMNFCKDSRIVSDEENVCGLPNLEGFVDIRYDQSVLSLLAQKNSIEPSDFLRQFIMCNAKKLM